MSVLFHDMFCGAGGLSEGARQAGAEPVIGMNHWQTACDSWEHNHGSGSARAACVDVVTQDPRRYPPATMLLAGPSCTYHGYARGKRKDDPSLFDPEGDKAAERSRANMWDVVRFAEAHDYRFVIVENVEGAVKWGLPKGRKLKHGDYGPLFAAWLNAMESLDYRWRIVHLNSMVCGVPQSRDRLYVVFWKRGQRAPNLDFTALAWCPTCDQLVDGRQTWKRPGQTTGTHGASYFYACPVCAAACAPAVRPAAAAIDWTLPAPLIGDRKRPLKMSTIERVRRGLLKLRDRPPILLLPDGLVVQVGGNLYERKGYTRAWPISSPMPTVTATSERALVLPMRKGMDGRPASEPLATLSTRTTSALVMPAGGNPAEARDTGAQPMQTIMASDRLSVVVPISHSDASDRSRDAGREVLPAVTAARELYVVDPMIVETRGNVDRPGGGNDAKDAGSEPIGTVSAQGNHHFLVANYGSPDGPPSKGGYVKQLFEDPLGTVTARDKHALFTYRAGPGVSGLDEPLGTVATRETHALLGVSDDEVNACSFRMLRAHELKIGSGFPASYVLTGNHEDQVAQVGNAVNPPPGYRLVRACIESLDAA